VAADWYLVAIKETEQLNVYALCQLGTGRLVFVNTFPQVTWEGPGPWKIGERPSCGGRFVAPEPGD